jgi:uncharacterized membrane protein
MTLKTVFVIVAVASGLVPGPAAPSITVIDFPQATHTRLNGINPNGDIAGTYVIAIPNGPLVTHGFVLDQTGYRKIDVPAAALTSAFGINAHGDVVGLYNPLASASCGPAMNGAACGFLFTRGQFYNVYVPGSTATNALGINDSGDVVGFYNNGPAVMHGFLMQQGTFTTIDFPGTTRTLVSDINDRGDILGAYVDTSNVGHGFLLSTGVFTTIDVPGALQTDPAGLSGRINAHGEIVGAYMTIGPKFHGFLLDKNGYSSIDFPNSNLTSARGINPRGDVVGFYRDLPSAGGRDHGFLIRAHGQ